MSTILGRLAAEEILPAKTVLNLREYISRKNPSLSLVSKAAIFADAVNKVLSDKIPEMPEEQLKQFKVCLFRETARKAQFCIDGSDVFKSALRLGISDEQFIAGLGGWLEKTLEIPVSRTNLTEFVTLAFAMMNKSAGIGLDEVIELAEQQVGGISNGTAIGNESESINGTETGIGAGSRTGSESINGISVGTQTDTDVGTGAEAANDPIVSAGAVIQFAPENAAPENVASKNASPENAAWNTEENTAETGKESEASGFRSIFIRSLTGNRKQLRVIAAVGLVSISVLLSYFSALYINATENAGFPQTEEIIAVEQEELPAGAVVPADPKDSGDSVIKMKATAYDLSFESCGKARSHPAYGVTSSGTRATVGRTIAVDPEVIPLGSKVKLTFPGKYSYLDGVYIAEDTGRLIKGNRVDVFFGEDKVGSKTVNKLAMDFGVQNVEVEILE